MSGVWRRAGGRAIGLDSARVFVIINATPDSFSDAGLRLDPGAAVEFAHRSLEDGAAGLDVGGESTRPGAAPVDPAEQIRRVVPVVEALRRAGVDAPISIDTTSAEVARAALDAGADAVNDQSAGRDDPRMFTLAAERAAGLILMHRARPPASDRYSTEYDAEPDYDAGADAPPGTPPVVGAVSAFLKERAGAAQRAGVAREAIVVDPGLGFGKSEAQNYQLIAHAGALLNLGHPVLSAASRKSFIGRASRVDEPSRRVAGSVGVSVHQYLLGVRLFRVHDAAAHVQALRIAAAIQAQRPSLNG